MIHFLNHLTNCLYSLGSKFLALDVSRMCSNKHALKQV